MVKRIRERLRMLWRKWRECTLNFAYFICYRRQKIRQNTAIFESRSGEDFASNIYYLAREMEKRGIKVYIPYKIKAKKKIERIIRTGNFSNIHMVRMYSKKYYKILATAKYLFNDICFDWKYIKQPGQVYVNTWHGTPLKTIGFDVPKEKYVMGNIQRNLMMVDYLTSPSEYYTEKILTAYHIDKLFSGKVLHSGYPRNSVFFDQGLREKTRHNLDLLGQQVVIYMPTWRGMHATPQKGCVLQKHLAQLDTLLEDNQVLYVKLHNMDRQNVQMGAFTHIREFPANVECYQFLAIADCLITDYSSVFFDFANSGKKIILFTYDEKEYLTSRGMYFDMKTLPFPQVRTVEELVDEINGSKDYDDQIFRQFYCTYDGNNAAASIIDHILGKHIVSEQKIESNGKKNVVIYCGGIMLKNGIITSLKNLMSGLDTNQCNYFFSFTRQGLRSSPPLLEDVPEGMQLFPISSPLQKTLLESWAYHKYYEQRKKRKIYKRLWDRLMKREMKKHFPQAVFDVIIDFEGYGTHQMIPIIQNYPGKRVIFVHSNMREESRLRNNHHPYVLREAYHDFDVVAVVSPSLRVPTMEISGRADNIVVVENSHNYRGIRNQANKLVILDRDTEVKTWNPGGILGALSHKGYKFITIGRFSPEKGHLRLLEAFNLFCKRYSDAQLIIIGGHGNLYAATLKHLSKMSCCRNVTVIKSMRNPMPILKQCDLFILPSLYEGLGLVLLEADCLGVPSFCVSIDGPKDFMKQHKGHLVENSVQGILQGMYDFVDGKVHTLDIDYEEYNRTAREEFLELTREG